MTDLPQPLTPADSNLRGMPYMPLDVIRLLDSDMFAESTGDEFKAAVALWCKSWTQVPAGSLPNNDKVLAHLSGYADRWKRIKAGAMRGWVLCSNDRWYHPVVAEKVLAALPSREEFNSKKSADAERKAREREDRKALFELLKSHGATPEWNVSTKTLRAMAVQYASQEPAGQVTDMFCDTSHHVTVSKGEGKKKGEGELTSKAEDDDDTAVPDYDPPRSAPLPVREEPPLSNDPAIQLSVALRRQGVNATFTHPAVQDWVAKGVTIEMLTQAVATARETKGSASIPPNYLVPIVADLLNPPAAAPASTKPAREDWSWKKTDQGCNDEGAKYGLRARGGESRDSFIARIEAAKLIRRSKP